MREKSVSTRLSEEEYEYVMKQVGCVPVASYLRKLLLTANSGQFNFEIKTDDIKEVGEILSEFNQRHEWFIGSLRYRNELYDSDIRRLENLLEEVNASVKELIKTSKNDRKHIRKQGIKYLNAQIDKVLKRGDG